MFVFSLTISLALLALGTLFVACEFLRPGLILPAVTGSLLLVFATHSLWLRPPDLATQWPWALAFALPVVAILVFLLRIARRARRNKRITIF